jgi:hypothetical protein
MQTKRSMMKKEVSIKFQIRNYSRETTILCELPCREKKSSSCVCTVLNHSFMRTHVSYLGHVYEDFFSLNGSDDDDISGELLISRLPYCIYTFRFIDMVLLSSPMSRYKQKLPC